MPKVFAPKVHKPVGPRVIAQTPPKDRVVQPPFGPPQTFGAKRPKFANVVISIGATSAFELCLDAGDEDSFPGPNNQDLQVWYDVSGQSYDFYIGQTATPSTDDPTFFGTYGGRSAREYFYMDGGDHFHATNANPTWVENIHKDNASYSFIWIVSVPATSSANIMGNYGGGGANNGWRCITSNDAPGHTVGMAVMKGAPPYFMLDPPAGSLQCDEPVWKPNRWVIMGVSMDEAAGAGGSWYGIDGKPILVEGGYFFDGSYDSPSASAANDVLEIGRSGDNTPGTPVNEGFKYAGVLGWNRAITIEEFAAFSTRVRGVCGI